MKEFDIDTYQHFKKLVIDELMEDAEEDISEAEEILNLIEDKMLDGGERDHFMPHLIRTHSDIDTLTERVSYLHQQHKA